MISNLRLCASSMRSDVWLCVQAMKVPLEELAVRFNCAMQDLQLLGLIREATRRRRESSIQRLVFPMRS